MARRAARVEAQAPLEYGQDVARAALEVVGRRDGGEALVALPQAAAGIFPGTRPQAAVGGELGELELTIYFTG
eukprot:11210864-Lingulodinium_polyedra.AAC.1